eukprot:NODE_9972_length_499_cov_41.623656_g9949_i0.p1 GENE.NODE_9972_length_499_cov_41.623656_g9949_i0~~NODE_9972_length_499_cov_41.623656_g9949_i0.p1  ORF type:complete len:131 (-),score=14.44 NODE_9972_length_499_cov_41.623656_g9949_i0:38-430(-)
MDGDDARETVKIYHPSYLMKPRPGTKFMRRNVETAVGELLEERLKEVKYDAEDAASLSKELCAEIQNKVKGMGYERYKLVTQVVITEGKGQGQRIASRCLWDPEEDNFAQASYRNSTLICTAIVFACYWE